MYVYYYYLYIITLLGSLRASPCLSSFDFSFPAREGQVIHLQHVVKLFVARPLLRGTHLSFVLCILFVRFALNVEE